jgi:ubiquinone/menaquinone biosynthesis C-methylase UbiE
VSGDERARIEVAYGRRAALDARYDQRLPEVVAAVAAVRRAYGATLLAHGCRPERIVEIGCGTAGPLAAFLGAGRPFLVGIDLQVGRLQAAQRTHPSLGLLAADARQLPLAAATFDAAICSTLFSSILHDEVARVVAREIDRILTPGGVVLWFDLRVGNPSNPDVRGVPRRMLTRLFPGYDLDVRPCVLAPPVARRLSKRPVLSALAEQVRPLRSHLGGGLWKPAGPS